MTAWRNTPPAAANARACACWCRHRQIAWVIIPFCAQYHLSITTVSVKREGQQGDYQRQQGGSAGGRQQGDRPAELTTTGFAFSRRLSVSKNRRAPENRRASPASKSWKHPAMAAKIPTVQRAFQDGMAHSGRAAVQLCLCKNHPALPFETRRGACGALAYRPAARSLRSSRQSTERGYSTSNLLVCCSMLNKSNHLERLPIQRTCIPSNPH